MRRSQLTQRLPMGSLFKVLAIYPTAWWRAEGLNGAATGDRPTLGFAADSSPPGGKPGILASFIAGTRAVNLSTASRSRLRTAILADLAAYYGQRAAHPVDLIVVEWPKDRWTGGAFTAFMQPGTWTGYGQALRESVGLISWAGTEVADRWSGYFDGAVGAGYDAANRALKTFLYVSVNAAIAAKAVGRPVASSLPGTLGRYLTCLDRDVRPYLPVAAASIVGKLAHDKRRR
jgi:monoamine oxidase